MKRISSLCKLPQLYSFHTTRVVRNERFNDVYSLAVQNLFRGNYKKAEEIYYKALQMDLNDPLKFHLLSDLATVQKLMGSFSKAAENYKRALKIFSKNKKIGVESSSLAIIIINLAIVMASNGNITKAESLISQIFKMKHLDEKLFPFLEEYALVLLKLGKVKKAKEHFDKLWSLIESNNFEEYPKSYMILHHLGTCQAALGDLLPSTVSHIKALQICEEKFGSNSKEVAGSCEMVGTQYLNIGCEEEASEYFSRALEIAKDLDPKKESELLCNIHILKARIDLKRGDYMASLKTCFDAIDFEMNGNLIAKVYYYMAKCYEGLKNLDAAKIMVEKMEELFEKNEAAEFPLRAMSYSLLGSIFEKECNLNQAEIYFRKSLEYNLKYFGENGETKRLREKLKKLSKGKKEDY